MDRSSNLKFEQRKECIQQEFSDVRCNKVYIIIFSILFKDNLSKNDLKYDYIFKIVFFTLQKHHSNLINCIYSILGNQKNQLR